MTRRFAELCGHGECSARRHDASAALVPPWRGLRGHHPDVSGAVSPEARSGGAPHRARHDRARAGTVLVRVAVRVLLPVEPRPPSALEPGRGRARSVPGVREPPHRARGRQAARVDWHALGAARSLHRGGRRRRPRRPVPLRDRPGGEGGASRVASGLARCLGRARARRRHDAGYVVRRAGSRDPRASSGAGRAGLRLRTGRGGDAGSASHLGFPVTDGAARSPRTGDRGDRGVRAGTRGGPRTRAGDRPPCTSGRPESIHRAPLSRIDGFGCARLRRVLQGGRVSLPCSVGPPARRGTCGPLRLSRRLLRRAPPVLQDRWRDGAHRRRR